MIKANTAFTTEEEMEIHQQREQFYNLKEKIERMNYQVTQIEIDKRPRLQKLYNMFKIKAVEKLANKIMEGILEEKDLNITELNHPIYATATVITEEINETAGCKIGTQKLQQPPWVRHIQGSIKDIRKELSVLVEIRRDNRRVQNIKRNRLFKKYNIENEEDLN
jgi:TolA-binding protein